MSSHKEAPEVEYIWVSSCLWEEHEERERSQKMAGQRLRQDHIGVLSGSKKNLWSSVIFRGVSEKKAQRVSTSSRFSMVSSDEGFSVWLSYVKRMSAVSMGSS